MKMRAALQPKLAGSFHVVAPDYPGFGQSSMPDRQSFPYTFENLTNVVETLVEQLGLGKFSLYVMDYGAPVGYRLALRHPEQVQALIVQNGNAYDEGLREFWDPIKQYWEDPRPENRTALHFLVDAKSTRWQYENGVADLTLLDPTTWILDQVGLDRTGNREIQMGEKKTMATREINVQRFSITSSKRFGEVMEAIGAAVGHPDMGAFGKNITSAKSFADVKTVVLRAIGPSGFMEFIRFDLGKILQKDRGDEAPPSLRIVIGNPLIMKQMVERVPDAGSYAPVTILIDERTDGVHLSYDRMASFLASYGNADSLKVAQELDAKVEALLAAAAK